MRKDVALLMKDLRAVLERIYGGGLRGIYVYGSHARGEASAGSDVDVALVLADFDDPWTEIRRTSEAVSEVSLRHGMSVSLYRVREAEWNAPPGSPLLRNIHRDSLAA